MPNPTTINEDQLMNISETITKLRERAEALMNLTDDVCEIIAVNPVLREYLSASNAINILKILDHFEARESEKPREWWTLKEKTPNYNSSVLLWDSPYWSVAYLTEDEGSMDWHLPSGEWLSGIREDDIWREMPPAPVIGEGK